MINNLDILLINPSDRKLYGNLNRISAIEPPLFAALIAGYIRNKDSTISIKIIDANADNLSSEQVANRIIKENAILTGIVVMGSNPSVSSTPKMTAAEEILIEFTKKKRNIEKDSKNRIRTKVFLSGLHPSALPEDTLLKIKPDFVIQGEGFNTIYQLFTVLRTEESPGKSARYNIKGLWYFDNDVINREGIVISNPPVDLIKSGELPSGAWDLLDMNKYIGHTWHCLGRDRNRYGVIYTSLGCPFNCEFCNIHAMYNNKPGIRYRDTNKIIEEIDLLVKKYSVRNIKIFDELFALKEDRIIEICDLIIEKDYKPKLNFWCYGRVDTITERMLSKMKEAGINWIAIGFESANSILRKNVSKRYSQDKIRDTVKMIKDVGINIIANFIFGLPGENIETMQNSLNLAKELNCEYINFYVLLPYPGSQLFEDAMNNNVRLPERWEYYSQYSKNIIPMDTKYLTGQQVLEFRDKIFQEYYTNPYYIKMMREKFGDSVIKQIEDMIKIKIR